MKVLNSSQKKKLLLSISKSINPKDFLLLQKEKRLYIASKGLKDILQENISVRSIGLFLGTLENKQVVLSPSAKAMME